MFSKWTRLLRATARALQFIALCRRKGDDPTPAGPETVAAARRKRTRANCEQDGAWNERDTRARQSVKPAAAPKNQRKFVVLNAHYLGRGRVAMVLDGKHPYTKLYISHVHEKLHYGDTEIVVNELRQRVHITKIRTPLKEAIALCAICRIKKAKPAAPATGDLPAARLAHHARPFTYTGLDYFGPLEVTVGRHREKRHVALFTCMTSRAVHLEVAVSLSTDSAINALRRFIALRGCPTELWSDNATAFKSSDRELTEALQEAAAARRITEALQEAAAVRRISWRFPCSRC
ncbi:uncharacterized protein [Choristoneura fumiferana]|uniref:uncharacterized protein n=1 Tax=Choristoneura fumiferana TaxID=7141 RepID=UPI003D15BFCE